MRAEQTSFLFGANAPFIEELYARYLADPASVDGEWQTFFAALAEQKDDVLAEVRGASWAPHGARVIGAVDPDAVPTPANRNVKGGKAANGAAAPVAPAIAGKTEQEIRNAAQDTARALMLMGSDVLFYPTAIGSEPHDDSLDTARLWRRAMVGHAVSNVVPVVAANRVGTEHGQTFYGTSFITDERGDILAELDREEEGVITATLDLARVKRHRAAFGFFRDRRPDLYGRLVADV